MHGADTHTAEVKKNETISFLEMKREHTGKGSPSPQKKEMWSTADKKRMRRYETKIP